MQVLHYRVYLDPDSNLECVIHKPLHHNDLENLNNETLLRMTMDIIESAYQSQFENVKLNTGKEL